MHFPIPIESCCKILRHNAYNFASGPSRRQVWLVIKKEKRGPVSIARPTIGGSGLPFGVERATQKPHAEYDIRPLRQRSRVTLADVDIHIHRASTVAKFQTPNEIFQISDCQE